MVETEIIRARRDDGDAAPVERCALAAGLFGYSISRGQMGSFKPTEGYLRDIEQMPSFAPPSVNNFVIQYLSSNVGRTRSSS
ncbi:hypothetical protein [uncultured Parasphingorhabdus sp.]|uniref:hypothetical protein n=1 Tax=uncultured Parasphingorhabdus sp. TaxID=2709694 RepID=UPI0030DDD126|tara:strand:+ start:8750 stop:8995 length:246 start_codon:yes stop_codon:yes gene_type:complete